MHSNSPFIFRDVISKFSLPEFRKKQVSNFGVKVPLLDKKKKILEPSTNGKIINCKYHLEISPQFNACCNTWNANTFILPLTIQGEGGITVVDAPNDWKPKMFDSQMLLIPNRDSFIRR